MARLRVRSSRRWWSRLAAASWLLTLACATPTPPRSGGPSPLVSLVLAQAPQRINAAEIEAAQALLSQARTQLEPGQYALLERELVEAESAFQRYAALARASGEVAEVARGAEALVGARSAAQIAEELGPISRVGPVLVALAVLWPSSSIATQSEELPPKLVAEIDLQAALQRVVRDSRRVGEEIEAARRPQGARDSSKAAGPLPGKAGAGRPPGDPPCYHVGTNGSGAYRPAGAPPDWITCVYACGEKQVEVTILGKSGSDCERPEPLEQARRKAERMRKEQEGR